MKRVVVVISIAIFLIGAVGCNKGKRAEAKVNELVNEKIELFENTSSISERNDIVADYHYGLIQILENTYGEDWEVIISHGSCTEEGEAIDRAHRLFVRTCF